MVEGLESFGSLLLGGNLQLILNALDEGIHIVDEDGKTILYNKKVSEIDGLEPEEVLGRSIFEVYPSLTHQTSTLIQTLKDGQPVDSIQQSFINTRGKKITTINKTVPIKLKGNVVGAMEISRDITQLKELAENISHLRTSLGRKRFETGVKKKELEFDNNTIYTFKDIIGESPLFKDALEAAMKAAGSSSSVLLVGETGTGKELFAQSIHNASRRSRSPFIAQNCAALPRDLLESLLFGTEKGGFTGAQSKPGLFEQADGGTILLDEINSMDLTLQAKILRTLQDNKVRRIGGQKEVTVDVRVIATMNTPPDQAFKEKVLREDLFYRLSVVYIELPPLRERSKDIDILLNHFIRFYNGRFLKTVADVEPELKELFNNYDWPGNVRELQHVIESAFNMLQEQKIITYSHLPGYIKTRLKKDSFMSVNLNLSQLEELPPLGKVIEKIESALIKKALAETEGNISAAARRLEISRQSLQYKIKKYNLGG